MVCISPIKDRCIFLFAGIILQRNVLARNMRRYACRVRILAIAFDQVKIQERTWPKIKFGPAQSQMRHITSTFGPLLCHLVIPIGPKNPGYIFVLRLEHSKVHSSLTPRASKSTWRSLCRAISFKNWNRAHCVPQFWFRMTSLRCALMHIVRYRTVLIDLSSAVRTFSDKDYQSHSWRLYLGL